MEAINQILTQGKTSDSKITCQFCGKEKIPMELDFAGIIRKVYPACKCETDEYERLKIEDEQKEKQNRLENMFRQSRLGERFRDSSFENFILRKGSEKAYELCKGYAENFYNHKKNGQGLLLSSKPGTGKTHLTAAITNKLVKNMTSVIFIVVPELMQQIRSTYGQSKETESQIMHGLTECDLLILDDIGAEKTTDWTTEKIFTVIDSRYRNKKPTLFTTNCDAKELTERLGIRTFSRMMEVCTPVTLECDDYRLRGF